ncbi:hypothetical protein B0T22DRAFT_380612 [Podospora appendiculata]|uniref:Rhodopsin domain-containing protein n=1 Tax=Podospora appendiculata TaxID=314037 RepID=A0AAE1CD82_9PEZI|nr:hypothetical protein B0T22DRAFT_380612 [Podospora appendiculata]
MTFLSGCFLGLRVYCKALKRRGLWWDDCMLIAAWIALLANTVVLIASIQLGLGMHMDDIHLENLATVGLLGTLGGSFSILAAVWSKTSFGLTLLRIAQKKTRIVVWVIIVTMNLAMVMIVVTSWIQCNPFAKVWNRLLPGSCWDARINVYYGLFAATYSGVMDIVLALLPWSIVWNLQMRRKEKIGVAVAMSMGVFAGCTAFIKCSKIPTILTSDFTYDGYILIMWGSAEVAITIMAASIPVLRVLIRDVGMVTRRPYSGKRTDPGPSKMAHITTQATGRGLCNSPMQLCQRLATTACWFRAPAVILAFSSKGDEKAVETTGREHEGKLNGKIMQTQEVAGQSHERKEPEKLEDVV